MMKTYLMLASMIFSASVWAQDNQIEIHDYAFVPADITIPAGTKVTWVNRDQVPHTIAENAAKFRSPALDTSDQYARSFDTPGTYLYFCTLHPQMRGKIIVTEKK